MRNHRPSFLVKSVLLAVLVSLFTGCAALAVGGVVAGAAAIHDRRSVGTVIDDQTIEQTIYNALADAENLNQDVVHLRVVSYNGAVLLAGQVPDERHRLQIDEFAANVGGVTRIVNELQVGPPNTLRQRSSDSLLTGRVKTSLVGLSGMRGFDPTRVNVTTVDGVVYLMGLVTENEAEAVVEKVRHMRGVQRVVKVFEYAP